MNALEIQLRFCNETTTVQRFSLDWEISSKDVQKALKTDTRKQLCNILESSQRPSYLVDLFENALSGQDIEISLYTCLENYLKPCWRYEAMAEILNNNWYK